MKVLLITSGQPSLNPRLVKEADALADAGYEVTVLYSYWNKWGADFDKQLLAARKWKAICVGGDPVHSKLTYLVSRLFHKSANYLFGKKKDSFLADLAIARASYFLIREARKHTADLYIGHNLGALPAVVAAAKANNKPCGFDAEDFHRNETSDDQLNLGVILKTKVEDKYLPQLNYLTTSSPQIADAYRQLYPFLKPVVLLNVFSVTNVDKAPHAATGPLKIFWFSQTIGHNRGLQDIVKALKVLEKDHFELHILGSQSHSDPDFISYLKDSGINIMLYNPVPPEELVQFASRFDIGLALEPGFALNNHLALSNKIFTYMQAGLAIVASDTTAQKWLINKNPTIGEIYSGGSTNELGNILLNFYQDRALLTYKKNESLRLAREMYNWEVESQKFLKVVKQILSA